MKDMLKQVDCVNEMSPHCGNIDKLWEIFTEKYYKAEKECIPKKLVYINGQESKRLSTPLDKKNLRKIKKKNKL